MDNLKPIPKVTKYNIKDVIIDGMELLLKEIGELIVPFDITKSNAPRETYEQLENGEIVRKRRVVIKKLRAEPINAIGDILTVDEEKSPELSQEVEILEELISFGWIGKFTIQIDVMSFTPDDRDDCVDLIKQWMILLTQDNTRYEDGLPYFYRNNILFCKYLQEYEQDPEWSLVNINQPTYTGILVYEMLFPFYGVHKDPQKIKDYLFIIIEKIKNPNLPTESNKERPTEGGSGNVDTGCNNC